MFLKVCFYKVEMFHKTNLNNSANFNFDSRIWKLEAGSSSKETGTGVDDDDEGRAVTQVRVFGRARQFQLRPSDLKSIYQLVFMATVSSYCCSFTVSKKKRIYI